MEKIINFIKKYGNVTSISAILILCVFICCLVQIITKIGVFTGTCGLVGSGLALIIYVWLLISEYGKTREK